MLAETLEDDKMSPLKSFRLRYLRGDLPPWFYTVFLALQSVALYKDSGKDAVRPIGVKHSLVRTFHREVVKQNRGVITEETLSMFREFISSQTV